MIGNVNPNMIVLAREARGLTQAELADLIGMSPTNLSKIERSDIGINDEVLETIAEKTDYPAHFFKQSGEIMPENLNYRKREEVAQKINHAYSCQSKHHTQAHSLSHNGFGYFRTNHSGNGSNRKTDTTKNCQ